jgi:hypothetical protein
MASLGLNQKLRPNFNVCLKILKFGLKNLFFGGVNAIEYNLGKKDLWAASDTLWNGLVLVLN